MDGISLSWRSLPQSLIDRHGLRDRIIVRNEGAESEYRFVFRDTHPLLPVWIGNELTLCAWGNHNRQSRLPRCGTVAQEAIQAGKWQNVQPEQVEIPASFGWDKGVWYRIKEGIQGILVRNEADQPIVYILTEPASHYYQVMTRNSRMPILCGERI
jgi:hypothetical protein